MKTVTVDADALRRILEALNGPPHFVRELQVLRGMNLMHGRNPIDVLSEQYNAAVNQYNKEFNNDEEN